MHIKYFGTGAALNPNVDTTHFVITDGEKKLYIDAGNGMNLAQRVLRGEIQMPEFIFMTHCHTDHLLGLPHLIRIIGNKQMTIIMSEELAEKVHQLMYIVGKGPRYDKKIEAGNITIQHIQEGKNIKVYDRILTPINLYSKKTEQFGFQLKTPQENIVFFGDEAIDVMNRDDLENYRGCDRLLCEVFCSEDQKEKQDPHPKAHISAKEGGEIAHTLKAKNAIFSHIAEDRSIPRTQQLKTIKNDIKQVYNGNVFVPQDEETINIA